MEPVFIFDIDGTIADCSHRLEHIQKDNPDWDTFYSLCVNDKPIDDVFHLLRAIALNFEIIFITGRSEKWRNHTESWINRYMFLPNVFMPMRTWSLYMRADGDHRPDYEIKKEIYERHIKDNYIVLGVFEDRDQVVKMWRELGLTCYQVADGSY